MTHSRRAFLTSALILISSCMYAHSPQQSGTPATLRVDNQGVLDMTVYVFRGAERLRLGIAGGLKVTVLPIPSTIVFGPTPLRFVGDPIGSNRRPVSDEITVAPGDEVTWIIRQ